MYIAIEGPDGSGKSTQCKLLSEKLTCMGYDNQVIREPGETGVGAKIRKILLADDVAINPTTELLLFMANRSQITSEILRHKDAGNKIIISDRCYVSSIVYQNILGKIGYNSDSDSTSVREKAIRDYLHLHNILSLPQPDLIVFLKYHDSNILEANLKTRGIVNRLDGLPVNRLYNDVSNYFKDYVHTLNTEIIDCDEPNRQLTDEEISKKLFRLVLKHYKEKDENPF